MGHGARVSGLDEAVAERLGPLASAVDARLASWSAGGVPTRLRQRDVALWPGDADVHSKIAARLGWLESWRSVDASRLDAFRDAVVAEGYRRVLLLGMGGSSLCPEVLREVFGVSSPGLDLRILDSTHPDSVRDVQAWSAAEKTLFVVASKSGTTAEVAAFERTFRAQADASSFISITDPDTELDRRARELGDRDVFVNDPNIGGRFSALSWFGMVPASLLGLDVRRMIASAEAMSACGQRDDAASDPGLLLGAVLGEALAVGRDKLTLDLTPAFAPFGAWVEQLIAESTGKQGQGMLPILDEPLDVDAFGDDRLIVSMELRSQPDAAQVARLEALESAGHPVVRVALDDLYDLGGEFLRWEVATAAAGIVQGINPFDEPNVTESKDLTNAHIARFEADGMLQPMAWSIEADGLMACSDEGLPDASSLEALLGAHLGRVSKGDAFALLAYVPRNDTLTERLEALRKTIARSTGAATTLGFGPRFLHSTGQLHKGGPDRAVFLQLVPATTQALPIPGRPFGFETLLEAQARGDLEALQQHGRRVVRVSFVGDPAEAIDRLRRAVS